MRPGELIEAVKAVRIEGMLAKWNPQVQAANRGTHVLVVLVMHADLPAGPRLFEGQELVPLEMSDKSAEQRALEVVHRLLGQAVLAVVQECVLPGSAPGAPLG